MGQPAARIGDMHVCPMVTPGVPPIPHVGGPITGPGAPTVLIGGMPASVMGDMCVCVGPPDTIILGSVGVLICGKPAARMGDSCAHGGTITLGCPTVLIGEAGGGGGGGLGPMPVNIIVDLMGTMPPAVRAQMAQVATMKQAADDGVPFCPVVPTPTAAAPAAKNTPLFHDTTADTAEAGLDKFSLLGGKIEGKAGYIKGKLGDSGAGVEAAILDLKGSIINNPLGSVVLDTNVGGAQASIDTLDNTIASGFNVSADVVNASVEGTVKKIPIPLTDWNFNLTVGVGAGVGVGADAGISAGSGEDDRYEVGGHLGGKLGVGVDLSLKFSFGKNDS